MSLCVSCNSAPPPCDCSSSQTCVQTPRNCTTCPQNICVNLSDSSSRQSSPAGLGGIVGGAIGATTAAILVILSLWILYKRNCLPSCLYHLLSDGSNNNNNNNNNRPTGKKNHHLQKFHLNPSISSTATSTTTTTTTTTRHKSIFSRQPLPHDINSISPIAHRQSVIFLPSDDSPVPKSSPLESDDDPFSDVHSGVSIIGPRPNSKRTSPYPNDDRDAFSKANIPSDQHSSAVLPHTGLTTPSSTSAFVSNPNQRTSLVVPNTIGLPAPPPPTTNPSNTYKPMRPHRAPDLDLRLPGAKHRSDPDQPSPNNPRPNDLSADLSPSPPTPTIPTTPSYPKNNFPSLHDFTQTTIDSSQSRSSEMASSSFSHHPTRLSGFSDTASHDSHLSSILDPAMIVTPVTLVRTASGRQAAVQRVALRGQEKARVVRLPPSSNPKPHVPSPLSLETNQADVNSLMPDCEKFPETFKFTPSINLALGSRLSWDLDSPLPQTRGSSSVFIDSSTVSNQAPTTNQAVHANTDQREQNNNNAHKHWGSEEPSRSTKNRSTAAYSTRSSVGSSSVCESFLMDEEEVEFPTVLGRSAAILAHRQQSPSNQPSNPTTSASFSTALEHPSTAIHHHVNVKALGRDRAISLSSIIGEEAARNSFNSSPPPLPDIPLGAHLIAGRNKGSNNLPEPFKPFAGQKPSSSSGSSSSSSNSNNNGQSGSSHNSNSNAHVGRSNSNNGAKGGERQAQEAEEGEDDDDATEGKRRTRNPEFTQSTLSHASQQSRLSTVSSIRSGYGSVLEGIPFNIGFNSESDDLFNLNHPSSNLNLNFSFSLGGATHTGSSSPICGPNSVVNSSSGSVGRMSGIGSGHFSLGGETNRSSFLGTPTVPPRIGDPDDDPHVSSNQRP